MAGRTMRAVLYFTGGSSGCAPAKHVEVPIPEPNADEVLIKVEAASLNPVDYRMHESKLRFFFPRKSPYIIGTDVAGEVVKMGASVTRFKAGDKVAAYLPLSSGGALAEYAVTKETLIVIRPPQVSAAEAAALPIAALTAHQALTEFGHVALETGEAGGDNDPEKKKKIKNVLITAASGGVGHYAVQLAKLGDAHVTATCGARNVEFVRGLGADEVVDYRTPEGAALRSPSGRKYDVVVNCAVGIPWSAIEPNLAEDGRVVDLSPAPSVIMAFVVKKLTLSSKKRPMPMFLDVRRENFEYVVNLVKEGKIRTIIDSRYPLSKAELALAKMIDGHATGKIIVDVV